MATPDDLDSEDFNDLEESTDLDRLDDLDLDEDDAEESLEDLDYEDEDEDEEPDEKETDQDETADDELEEEPDEEEESLDVILAREQDLEAEFAPTEDVSRSSPTSTPAGEDEFICRSCFLVKRQAQLADPDELICTDCA